MLNPSTDVFPNNVISKAATALQSIDPNDLTILKRPLRASDPNMSIGVWGALWQPDLESYEMGHFVPGETTISSYQIGVQSFVKDGDEELGLKLHAILAYHVRRVLYRDSAFRVGLAGMQVTLDFVTERYLKWEFRSQRYMNNEVDGTFVFSTTAECLLTTELV